MTSIREVIRRLVTREGEAGASPSEFSYTVHWTGLVQSWDDRRRRDTLTALRRALEDAEFLPTEFERKYLVPEVDDAPHAGASLMALLRVLEALET